MPMLQTSTGPKLCSSALKSLGRLQNYELSRVNYGGSFLIKNPVLPKYALTNT